MTRPGLVVAALAVAGSLGAGHGAVVIPAGTTLPIRFLGRVRGGHDAVGTRVMVQTLGALTDRRGCIVVPAFTRAVGRVTVSRGGRLFGGRGALALRFDSLETRPGGWVGIAAVLDSLEYTPSKDLSDSGVVFGARASIPGRAAVVGLIGVSDVAIAPAAVLGGYWLARRGPPARILAGEVGDLRLTAALSVSTGGACDVPRLPPLPALAPLPPFAPRSETKGKVPGDPINLVLLGTGSAIEGAFARAGWVDPEHGSLGTVAREIVAGIASRRVARAPLSTQYFEGRRQDLAYELSGPTARSRHHVRLWVVDSAAGVWVGAANQDVGVVINPFIGRFTHRIRAEVDDERDRIVEELEASGCADLVDYVRVPGAVPRGRNATGQRFVTDARAAVVLVRPCRTPPGTLAVDGN